MNTYTAIIIFKNKETNVRIVFFNEVTAFFADTAKRNTTGLFPTASVGILADDGDIARMMEQSTEHAPIEQLIAQSTTD